MTEEDLKISELGAYTNNSMNKEGLKKLVAKVNSGGTLDAYTKAETDALLATKQGTLTAGDNVAISEENVISATDTKYTAGTNVSISEQNVISAIDTKYTAGTGITISEQNVISTTGGGGSTMWTKCPDSATFRTLFEITQDGKLVALKDICIVGFDKAENNDYGGDAWYIPKGFTVPGHYGTSISSPVFVTGGNNNSDNIMEYFLEIIWNVENDTVKLYSAHATFTFTIDNNVIAINRTRTKQENNYDYWNLVYYKD